MRGSVWQEDNGSWTWQYTITRGGQRRTVKRRGFSRKGLATDALNTALAEEQRGERIEPSKATVEEYLTEWLDTIKRKPSTQRGYDDIVKNRIVPNIGDIRMRDLAAGDVLRMYATLRASGKLTGKGGGLSETSIKHTHSVLHRALEHAVETRVLDRNPAKGLPRDSRPRLERGREMSTWSAEELRVFLASVAGDRLAPCFALAAMTGLRRGELLGLRWADVDLDKGSIAVRQARVAAGYTVETGAPKSGRSRTISIDPDTITVLRRHRTAQLQERMQWGEAWTDSGLVFTREDGTDLHPQSLSGAFERRVKRAPVTAIRFHDLRHTHASLLLAAGVHPKVVQERLGHASINITLDVYSHVTAGMQDDAAAKLGALVFGSGGAG